MAYDNNQQRRIQSPEESLHWISYNLKQQNELLKQILVAIQGNQGQASYQAPQSSYQAPKAPERRYNEPPRAYKEERQEEIPF